MQFDPGNFLVVEKALLPGVFQQLPVRFEAVDAAVERNDPLDGVDPDLLRAVFAAFDVPDPAVERDDVRFEGVFRHFTFGVPVGEADHLFFAPGVEDRLENFRIDARLDAGGAEQRLDHGGVEEFGGIRRQRLGDGVVHILIQGRRQDVGRQPGPEQGHADEVLLENGHVEFPVRVAQVIPPVGGIVLQRGLMHLDQIPDIAGDGAGAATERLPVFAFVLRQFPGEVPRVGIVVLLRLGDEFEFSQQLLAFLVHDAPGLSPA